MRKIILKHGIILCLLVRVLTSSLLNAQDNFLYAEKADSIFMPLDKSLITTNILYDRAFPLSRFDLYDPAIDTVDYEFVTQVYHELYQASYRRGRMKTPAMLNNMIEWENLRARVPIMVLDYLYNKMDSLAVQDGLFIYQNGMLYDNPNRTRYPYYTQHLQIAAPLIEEVKGNNITFILMPHFISRNTGLNVQQVSLNFSGNIHILTGPLDSITVNFSQPGLVYFTATVTMSNGSNFISKCRMLIGDNNLGAKPTGEYDPCRSEFLESDYAFQGYDEQQAFKGQFEINYYYRSSAQCNTSVTPLQKPIIIIDGYDPTDKRTAKTLGEQFLFYYDDVNYNPPRRYNIVTEMRDWGYDVIVVNITTYFHTYGGQIIPLDSNANDPPPGYNYSMGKIIRGGGDYVERNGLTLATLIQRINQQLTAQGSTEKLVVIGPSMGGQISRYALKWMENQGINHNVRLWVSFDSNHGGTIIPIGEQYVLKEAAGLINSLQKTLDRQLNSPHAKQSLLDHHLFHDNGNLNAGGAPDFHIRYYDMINTLGWPQQCRKIALISGAENGTELPIPRATELSMKLTVKAQKWGRLLLFRLCGAACYILNPPLIEASMYAAPQPNQNGKVSQIKIPLLFNLTRSKYGIGSPLTRNQSIETIQSGFYWGYRELTEKTGAITGGFIGKLIKLQIDMPAGYHAHQPTGNTLAYGKGINGNLYNFKWDDDVLPYNLSCDGYIPFEYYLGPQTFSLKHDSLFYFQAKTLIEEIRDIQHVNPPKNRQASITANKNLLCVGETATFTVTDPLPGMVYNWTPSAGFLQIISGQGTTSVTILHNGSPSDQGTFSISCQASSTCYIINSSYNFHVGVQTPSNIIGLDPPVPVYSGQQLQLSVPESGISYQWSVEGGVIIGSSTQQSVTIQVDQCPPDIYNGYLNVHCNMTNACGTGDAYTEWTTVDCSGGGFPLRVFPNPASDIIIIDNGIKKKSIKEIKIIDRLGNIKLQREFSGYDKLIKLNVSKLTSGIYYLQVFDGQVWKTKVISIVH